MYRSEPARPELWAKRSLNRFNFLAFFRFPPWALQLWLIERTLYSGRDRRRHDSFHTTDLPHLIGLTVFASGLVGRNYVLPTVSQVCASQVYASQVCICQVCIGQICNRCFKTKLFIPPRIIMFGPFKMPQSS